MYPTRAERFQTKHKRNRLKWLWAAAVLIAILLAVMVSFAITANLPKHTEQIIKDSPPAMQTNAATEEEPLVNLTFVGDIMMDGRVADRLKEKGYDFPFSYVKSNLRQDDFTVGNLETPVSTQGTPEKNKEFVYNSSPEAIPAMKAAGIDLVNLANNHSMDQGEKGLLDTFRVLHANQMEYVGAGADDNHAYSPVIVERKGVKIAFFGFSRVVPDVSWYSGKNKPGVAASYDPKLAVAAISAAKANADLVVVIAHWGTERVDEPVDHQKYLATAYIDAGADLVIGGHPHVLQGFESYRGKWIAYSLGNFIFTRSGHPKTWETMVLQANCSKKGTCELKMLPHHAELGQAVPMDEQDGSKLIKRIETISKNVQIEPDGSIRESTQNRSPYR